MKITDIRLGMLRAPLKTPFKTALRQVDHVEDVVVTVRTDEGRTGYGSAPATAVITGDTHASIIDAIRHHIGPRLIGMDIADLNRITRSIQQAMAHNTSAKAALEMAVHDLWGQLHGAPLYRLLGGSPVVMTTDITISVDGIDKMVDDALAAVENGFTSLKIKVGKEIDTDLDRIRAIHDAVQGRATLRLDVNQGWTARDAVRVLHALENKGIHPELLEQPVKAHDLEGMRYITERVHTPVMADESVFEPRDVLELIRMRAADIVNIKLMKAGGISAALRIVDIAGEHGMECMMSCMLESGIGVAAAAHVATARADVITKIDLDVPALCAFDPVDSSTLFDAAQISIADEPGLGIRGIQGLEPL